MSLLRQDSEDEALRKEFRNLRKQDPEVIEKRKEEERKKREKKRALIKGDLLVTTVAALKAMKLLLHEAEHIAKGTTHVCPAKQFPRAVQTQRTCPNTLEGELEELRKYLGDAKSLKEILEELEEKAKDAKQLTDKKLLDRRLELLKKVAKDTS